MEEITMAKKKTRKRRVRRKSRRKGRRRNPGNFVKPTVGAAERHLKAWAKQGVTDATQIGAVMGMKAPFGAKLDTVDDREVAKIRFREAQQITDAYEKACSELAATRKVTGAFKCPINKKSIAKYAAKAGNFRPVAKKKAVAYLKRLFRWSPKLKSHVSQGDMTVGKLVSIASDSVSGWLRAKGRRGDIGPRLEEAIIVAGVDKAQSLLQKAQAAAIRAAKKAEEKAAAKAARKEKRDAAKLKKIQEEKVKVKARLDKKLAELSAQEAKLQTVATAARRKLRAKRARRKARRSRRRNPVRRKARKAKRKTRRRSKAKRKTRRKTRRASKRKTRKKTRRKTRKTRKSSRKKTRRRSRR